MARMKAATEMRTEVGILRTKIGAEVTLASKYGPQQTEIESIQTAVKINTDDVSRETRIQRETRHAVSLEATNQKRIGSHTIEVNAALPVAEMVSQRAEIAQLRYEMVELRTRISDLEAEVKVLRKTKGIDEEEEVVFRFDSLSAPQLTTVTSCEAASYTITYSGSKSHNYAISSTGAVHPSGRGGALKKLVGWG
mmetsp:Transcript_30798/g.42153  ORF Transcript_30798/g.42153 Transcript_30798/m.42153 type:complete len:195 (+) Transcript_30798:850-1434(+)